MARMSNPHDEMKMSLVQTLRWLKMMMNDGEVESDADSPVVE